MPKITYQGIQCGYITLPEQKGAEVSKTSKTLGWSFYYNLQNKWYSLQDSKVSNLKPKVLYHDKLKPYIVVNITNWF